jgi:hypothetical protein
MSIEEEEDDDEADVEVPNDGDQDMAGLPSQKSIIEQGAADETEINALLRLLISATRNALVPQQSSTHLGFQGQDAVSPEGHL